MIEIKKVAYEDLTPLLSIIDRSYEAVRKGIDEKEEIKKNDQKIIASFIDRVSTSYKIMKDDKLIGGISLRIGKDNFHFLVSFFIDKDYQHQGIGTEVYNMIEEMYPEAVAITTACPAYNYNAVGFLINKCHFKLIKIENYHEGNARYLLEKYLKPSFKEGEK